MRLLRNDGEGNFSLTEYLYDEIPPYAILSHTWGRRGEEISFEDMANGATASSKSKEGYRKLEFCGRQAAKDGLSFFWVDTCCIDKTSSVELTEAINSMFIWYKHASRCYVYLQDILVGPDSLQSISSLHTSRWFTRSWTLQELLAPKSVEFFDLQGDRIGDKASMVARLQDITSIPHTALRGSPLNEFSVADRMSWALSRTATLEEDRIYSLLGILNVYMPPIYGEGESYAFKRLRRELDAAKGSTAVTFSPISRPRATSQSSYYDALAANGFRLMMLEPGQLGSKIVGHIREFDLSNPPPYYALSYVWGEEPALHQITINNTTRLVRPNLFHALQRIRAPQDYELILWVDSISIDQDNEAERSAQVMRMAQIYNKAAGVYIWLGEEDATSKLAIELVNKIYDSTQSKDPEDALFSWTGSWWKDYSFTALSLLMERSWFRRGWVLQEAAFSIHSTIRCGDRQLQMNHFAKVTDLIRSKFDDEARSIGLLSSKTRLGTLMNFIDSPAVRLLDLIQGSFVKTPEGTVLQGLMSLETLVYLATFSETSNMRDAIYTLLNLANDQGSLLRKDQNSLIVPDYSKSVISVFADFVRYCYSTNKSLDILCRPWAPTLHFNAQESHGVIQESTHLPSWIALREKLPYGDPSWRLKHRLHGNPLVGGPMKQIYNAHGGLPAEVIQGSNSNVLSVKGLIAGYIVQRSSRMADAIVTQECLFLLGDPDRKSGAEYKRVVDTWWRTLCADRDGNGDPAPSSWQSAMEDLIDTLNGDTISSIDIEELLETDIPEHVRAYLLVVREIVWNRRTFRSSIAVDGQLLAGLIPATARNDDLICILYGCSVPVVLRKLELPGPTSQWELIGDAYVHGIMNGEFMGELSEEERTYHDQIFDIR